MGAAAQLGAPAVDVHHADLIAVLLAEQSHCAHLLGLGNGHRARGHVQRLEDLLVDDVLHQSQLLRSHRTEVGKIEAQALIVLIRTSLMHMIAQYLTQGSLQQMRTRVVAGNGAAAAAAHAGLGFLPNLHHAVLQHTVVNVIALRGLLHVLHRQLGIAHQQHAVVGHLAAHFSIERSLIQNHQHAVLRAVVRRNGIQQLFLVRQGLNHAGVLQRGVAGELGGLGGQFAEQILRPAGNVLGQALGAGAALLLLHLGAEGLLVHLNACLSGDLLGQIQGEAEGIVQLEGLQTGQNAGAAVLCRTLDVVDQAVQDVHALVDGAVEAFLFRSDDLLNVIGMLFQLRITGLAGLDHGIHQLGQEGAIDAQHPAVTGGTAQQAAHHVTAALVGRQNAVAGHEGGGPDVVGNHADGDIGLVVQAVGLAAHPLHMVQQGLNGIHLKQVAHALHHAGQALQAHAGIDVGPFQQGVIALAVGVVLAEHQVPYLHKAVALATHMAIGLAAAMFGAAVKVDFAAGAAGAGAMLPEVVLFAEAHHVVRGDADGLRPDVVGLIVVLINGDVQLLRRDFQFLVQEFPSPGNGLILEIILEAEVAQHLKEGAMARGNAHALDVRGTDALLAGGHPMTGRLFLAQEPFLHGGHAAVDQQQAGVILRHQREAVQPQVTLAFKKAQVFFTQFIESGPFHSF